ncbi:MAG: hypothetical protein KBG20_15670 [Caldilineaceae bacterium]|nr:hypothetical protein [Caldilineaceae bacterium]MBP8108439.1 hypothetical protein [Caldilineaceae bacterium]MBP8123494.1 hypothetical protein [Caldilineaceae bacterium]MBP9073746.1 hypothetical protein [Caldilineaceae bacterium]
MQIALQDLNLEHLWVIYPGRHEYALDERSSVLPLEALPRLVATLGQKQAGGGG